MKKQLMAVGLMGIVASVVGCQSLSYLERDYTPARAAYGKDALPVPAPTTEEASRSSSRSVTPINPDPSGPMLPGVLEETKITGTWTFTTPTTVTRVERRNADLSQFSLYNGRPGGSDTPFVVITVSPDARSQAENDAGTYQIKNVRSYVLNGNIAKEWTGFTKNGAAFCELIITKAYGSADVCHAVAIVKNSEERKVALDVLGSIVWTSADAK